MRTIHLTDDEARALDALVDPITITTLFERLQRVGFTSPEVANIRNGLVAKVLLTVEEKTLWRMQQLNQ